MRIKLVFASLLLSSIAVAQEPVEEQKDSPPPEEDKAKEPERGDFNAGAQVRLPNGPGDDGTYSTWNWVAVDAKGKYYLLKWVTIDGTIPLAVKKPDMAFGEEP